jgi:hypothetical protein
MNQLFTGSNDYNEVWSLLANDAGEYYFAILYMQNSDPSHVIIEHQLRLNDYRRLNGQIVEAKWSKEPFEHQVTVRTPSPHLTVRIDGFPFEANNNGVAFTGVPNGPVTVEVPDEISGTANSKVRFLGWSKYGSANPLTIIVNSTLDITANYAQQYQLVVTSAYGNPEGTGWYPGGANVTFSVESQIDLGNGTRHVFHNWDGNSNSTTNQSWTILNSPKQVAAIWQTQFAVTISTSGLPANLTATVRIGNYLVALNGSAVITQWADSNQPLQIAVQSTEIQSSTSNYFLSELRADNQTLTGALDVTKPINLMLVYAEKPKLATALSLQVWPTVAVVGYPLSITGTIDGTATKSQTIELEYSSAVGVWQELATVSTSQDGAFAYTWRPPTPGEYSIRSSWPGDSTHASAIQVVGIRVVSSSLPMAGGSDSLSQILQDGFASAKKIPYASALVGLAASLMTLGYLLAVFLVPGGSPIVGYLIGGVLVGFVYVFPVSAILVLFKSARSKRGPSLLWLTPILTVWLSSMALVFLGSTLATPPILFMAEEGLLVLSNVFAIPILAAFRLAKVVI